MRAFNIIFDLIAQSKPQNGHIKINELNRQSLRRANIEISDMLKRCYIEKQNESLTKETSSQDNYLVS